MQRLYPLLILSLLLAGAPSLRAQVVINEFSAANYDDFTDFFNESEDWIELYNTGSTTVDLSGYHLSDRATNSDKWTFPDGVSIAPGEHLLIWASNRDLFIGGELHTNFKITQTRNNEDVIFASPNGSILDSHPINVPNQVGHSWARSTDGGSTWGVAKNPSPGSGNSTVSTGYNEKPQIYPEAGFYSGELEVSLLINDQNSTVYYTTDGSEPSDASTPYTGPFTITETTVVKAISYSSDADLLPSFVDYHTFFMDEEHTVPVISVAGNEMATLMGGSQIEPWGSLELFDESGERVADATGEYNKHGNDSWAYGQRGIDFITRDQFGDDYAVKHTIFPEFTDRDRFQRLILKAAANDNYSFEDGGAHIRDAFVHTLSQKADLELDERTNEPCILYVNGEYWGVYEIREKVDDHDYTDYYYDQDRYDIDFIKTWGNTWEEYGSWDDWYELVAFITNNDMADDDNYAYVESQLNVLSLIDYIVVHSHNVSSDWLNWNTGWWRGRNPEGGALKWRYILWDEDATFGHYINYSSIPDDTPLADPCNPEFIPDFVDFEGHIELFTDLSANEQFFQLYINRYADLTNTYLGCEYMIALLDSMIARIEPEMPRQIARWNNGSMAGWQENVDNLRNFILTRCTIISEGIVDCYDDEGITGPFQVDITVEPEGSGKVRANTIVGLTYPWAATYFGGIDIELEALPEPGHEFVFWEVAGNTFAPDQFAQAIQLSLEADAQIIAYFTGQAPCPTAYDLAVEATYTTVDLNWTGGGDDLAYNVSYRLLDSGEDWVSDNVLEPAIYLQGLEPCSMYEMKVKTICGFSTSEEAEFEFMTSCVSDTEEAASAFLEVQVYPNPFSEEFTVDILMARAGAVQLKLFNAQGQQVYGEQGLRLGQGHHRLPVRLSDNLAAGMYLLQIELENEVLTERLVRF